MKKLYLSILFLLAGVGSVFSQDVEQAVRERLQAFFQTYIPVNVNIGTCRLDSVLIDFHRKTIRIYADNTFSYQPFRPETVNRIYRDIKEILPGPVTYFDITVFTDGHSINELIPNTYRNGKKDKSRLFTDIHYKDAPWVTRTSRPFEITRGLEGRHIALWQSHGKYYINNKDKWGWQRPRLFCTSEDQFTQSFILPYLIPMLENAGANVFTPRERDTQKQEIIVDNDDNRNTTNSLYLEVKSRKAQWEKTALPGFAQQKRIYTEGENPFHDGTARFAQTEKKKNKAFAEWVPDIPETGEYAVYVSYQSLPNSVSDAKYLVFGTTVNIDQSGTNVYKDALKNKVTEQPLFSSYYLEKGNFLKIDNVTLGYTFNFKNNKYVRNLRIYGNVTNLATITGYSGLTPDVNVTGLQAGIEKRGSYPTTRTFTFGVNFGF